MSDVPPPPTPGLGQRKLVALLGAAALLGSFSLAFMLGGKKAPTSMDVEKDLQIGMLDASSIDLGAQATPDNWVENTVPGIDGAPAVPTPAAPPSQSTSSVVQGDPGSGSAPQTAASAPTALREGDQVEPHALDVYGRDENPARKGATPAGAVAGNAQASPATAKGGNDQAGTATTTPTGTTGGSDKAGTTTPRPAAPSAASGQVAQTTPKSGTTGGSNKAGTTLPRPAAPSAGSGQVAQATPKSGTTGGSDKAGMKTTKPASTSGKPQPQESSPSVPHAIPVGVARVPGKESALAKPVFVRPSQERPGVVAQTRTLITEKQYASPSASKTGKPKPAAEDKAVGSAPAQVRQQDARSYAQQATRQLQQQKVLAPTQHVRLPRRAETTNPAVWHEDDTPASTDERRPFGLIVAEEKPGFTPAGIPLRTDIPAGASSLEQNGPDKPLWKRPE